MGFRQCWSAALLFVVVFLAPLPIRADEKQIPDPQEAAAPARVEPVFAVRELYAPGHFGNSYECLGINEMRVALADAASWGFNGYCGCFDVDDCKDPFASGHTYGLGDALWERNKVNYGSAQSLGLLRELGMTPNHVYLEQCLPELLATKSDRVFGQLICPSNPKARAIILKNHENLFADLARSGVRLTHIAGAPYDFGGCCCKQCTPWILTFAKLSHEIYAIAEKHHPGIKMNMVGWWWSAEEHRLFAEWVDREAPGWIDHMYLHLPYGETKVGEVPLPKGCRRGAFVHIGYAELAGPLTIGDQADPCDTYGHLGPIVAAERLQKTVIDLKAQGVTAIVAYSEGVHDDVNKAILAGLASGRYRTADDVLEAYARRYFGVDADTAKLWAAWLKAWGKLFEVDTRQSAATLETLLKKTLEGGWRLRQWELKQQLFAIHREIDRGAQWTPEAKGKEGEWKAEWTPERLAAVERFWAVQEQLQRSVWGLTAQRHAFARLYTPVRWYRSWAKFTGAQARMLGKEQ